MPSNINPIEPPKVEVAESKPDKAPPLRGLIQKEPEHPDVSSWVRKANQRLSGTWTDNERRCGRAFEMPGASSAEVRELMEVFSSFRASAHMERSGFVVTFKLPHATEFQASLHRK